MLEPAGLGGGELSLVKKTQMVLKAAEGALLPCFGGASPAPNLPLLYPGPGNLLLPEAVSLYRKYQEKLSFAASFKLGDPFRLEHLTWQWAAPKCFPGTWKKTRLVAKPTEKEIKTLSLAPTPLHLCKHFIFSHELQKHLGSNQWGKLYTELNFPAKISHKTAVPPPWRLLTLNSIKRILIFVPYDETV